MSYSHRDIIHAFCNGKTNKTGGNVFSRGNVVFSYGSHFPLLIKNKNGLKIMNADKYSTSTSKHQHLAIRAADISFPFSAFSGLCAKYKLSSPYYSYITFFDNLLILDKTEPRSDLINYYRCDTETKKEYISISQYETLTPDKKHEYIENIEYRPGASLIKLKNIPRKMFLCSMDNNQFYIVELNKAVKTIEEAFTQLKPPYLQKNPHIEYIRQGEWFFIDITDHVDDRPRRCWKTFQKSEPLPLLDNGNAHTATRLEFFTTLDINPDFMNTGIDPRTPVVMGRIRHPQHKPAVLIQDRIYIALKNTARQSWGATGRVD